MSSVALLVISVVLLVDVSTLVAAAATRAAVERRAIAAAVNWLGDGSWGDWGDGITVPSFVTFLLVRTIVERCCWWKCLAEMFGSTYRWCLMKIIGFAFSDISELLIIFCAVNSLTPNGAYAPAFFTSFVITSYLFHFLSPDNVW